jgi:hypothetical protein
MEQNSHNMMDQYFRKLMHVVIVLLLLVFVLFGFAQ